MTAAANTKPHTSKTRTCGRTSPMTHNPKEGSVVLRNNTRNNRSGRCKLGAQRSRQRQYAISSAWCECQNQAATPEILNQIAKFVTVRFSGQIKMNQHGEKVQGLGLLTRAMATSTGNILRSCNFAMCSHFQELAKHAQRWLAGNDVRRQTCAFLQIIWGPL